MPIKMIPSICWVCFLLVIFSFVPSSSPVSTGMEKNWRSWIRGKGVDRSQYQVNSSEFVFLTQHNKKYSKEQNIITNWIHRKIDSIFQGFKICLKSGQRSRYIIQPKSGEVYQLTGYIVSCKSDQTPHLKPLPSDYAILQVQLVRKKSTNYSCSSMLSNQLVQTTKSQQFLEDELLSVMKCEFSTLADNSVFGEKKNYNTMCALAKGTRTKTNVNASINEIDKLNEPMNDDKTWKNTSSPFLRLRSYTRQQSLLSINLTWGFPRLLDNVHNNFLLTWETVGGGLKGNLVTDENFATISLILDTAYTIQVGVLEDNESNRNASTLNLMELVLSGSELKMKNLTGNIPTLVLNTSSVLYPEEEVIIPQNPKNNNYLNRIESNLSNFTTTSTKYILPSSTTKISWKDSGIESTTPNSERIFSNRTDDDGGFFPPAHVAVIFLSVVILNICLFYWLTVRRKRRPQSTFTFPSDKCVISTIGRQISFYRNSFGKKNLPLVSPDLDKTDSNNDLMDV